MLSQPELPAEEVKDLVDSVQDDVCFSEYYYTCLVQN